MEASDRSWPLSRLLLLAGAFFLVKLHLAGTLWPFRDEAFFWQCSRRPDWGYSDLPAGPALLVGLGRRLGGDTPLAIRSVFLALGTLLPALLYAWALPLVGAADARMAAGLCMLLPVGAGRGYLAVPDVPLAFATLAFAVALERASRDGRPAAWAAAGLAGAAGFLVHYRFLFPFLGACLYLLATPRGRGLLATRGPWLAGLLTGMGLVPLVIHNLAQGGAPAMVQFVDRHEWRLQPDGLRHLVEQAWVHTPLLYLAILGGLAALVRRAGRGDDRAALVVALGGFPVVFFAAAALFSASPKGGVSWPLAGLILLLPFAPGCLRALAEAWPRVGSLAGHLTVGLALLGSLAWMGAMLCIAHVEHLGGWFTPGSYSTEMVGWGPVGEALRRRIREHTGPAGPPALLVERAYSAALVDFAIGGSTRVYNLQDGTWFGSPGQLPSQVHPQAQQYRVWELDEPGLAKEAGRDALLVVVEERARPYTPTAEASLRRVSRRAGAIELLERLDLLDGAKRVGIYLCRGLRAQPGEPLPDRELPLPAH